MRTSSKEIKVAFIPPQSYFENKYGSNVSYYDNGKIKNIHNYPTLWCPIMNNQIGKKVYVIKSDVTNGRISHEVVTEPKKSDWGVWWSAEDVILMENIEPKDEWWVTCTNIEIETICSVSEIHKKLYEKYKKHSA